MRLSASRRIGKRGLTLVEVCLVLALLVVIAAVATPLLEGSFARASLQGGSDLLRGAWARARLAAMESGLTYVFRFQPNGGRYQIVTLNDLGMPGAETVVEGVDPEYDVDDMMRVPQPRLPEGVIFAAADISTSSQVLATLGTTEGGVWSNPILFHPDGTTSDASVLLSNDSGQTVRVTLRGLTGISNVGDVGSEAVGP
jgi:prepilin-type N-terminal cleavage/methylation domain-containing protein